MEKINKINIKHWRNKYMKNIKSIDTIEFMGSNILIFMDNDMTPWFVGTQLLKVMEYNTTNNSTRTIERNVDSDCRVKLGRNELESLISKERTIQSDGTPDDSNIIDLIWKGTDQKSKYFVDEASMYSLVLSSKKNEAKSFRHWLTKEVLPSIRRDGYYQMKPVGRTVNSL